MSGASDAVAGVLEDMYSSLRSEAAATRQAVENRARQQRKVNLWLMTFILVTVVLCVAVFAVLMQNRARSLQNGQILRNSANTNQVIADCTSPAGRCYQANSARTALVLTAALTCAKTTDTDDEMLRCIKEKMAAGPIPSTSPAP